MEWFAGIHRTSALRGIRTAHSTQMCVWQCVIEHRHVTSCLYKDRKQFYLRQRQPGTDTAAEANKSQRLSVEINTGSEHSARMHGVTEQTDEIANVLINEVETFRSDEGSTVSTN